ncbi:ATP-binding protein [Streptomyces sp. NPDC058000]|uniref:ATP-binding protein n=1 Tax=Streptomyces sp. NPDC058000 TaxID=3346299 RepID=UPI0036E533F3
MIAGNHNVVVDAQHGSTVTLLVEQERPRPVRRDRVALLPRRQHDLVGRDADVAALAGAVRTGGPVQLFGPPGVGKSTLLRHAARHLAPGPDGVLFLTAAHREVGDLAQELFEACYEAAGYAPSTAELRRLMTGVRVTVYVDSADLTSEQLTELADSAPDATFVVASRERSLLGDGTTLEIKGLGRAAGLDLLTRELQRPLLESEIDVAGDLWRTALGRPLLLLRAAGLARFDPSGEAALPRPGAIADLLPLLFDQLDTAAMNTLHLFATLGDAELDPTHVGALTDEPGPAALCGRLADLGLVMPTELGYRCAPDAVEALRQRLPKPFPADRLCGYFARWATQSTTTPDQVAAHGRALEAAVELAELTGRPDLAVKVARAASPTLARSLRFGVWGRLLGRGWVAANHAGDKNAMAYFTHEEGIRSLLTGRRVISAVLLAEAVLLWRELGDTHGANAAVHAQQYAPPPAHPAGPPAPHDAGGHAATGHGTAGHGGAGHGAGSHAAGSHTAAGQGGGSGGTHAAAGQSGGTHAAAGHGGGTHVVAGHGGTATSHAAVGHGATAHPAAAHMAALGKSAAPHVVHGLGHGVGHAGSIAAGTAGATGAAGATGTASIGTAVAVGTKGVSLLSVILAVTAAVTAAVIGGIAFLSPARGAADLAGNWRDGQGNEFSIVASGSDSYMFRVRPPCAGSTAGEDAQVTGSDGTYSGSVPLFDENSSGCSSVLAHTGITITLASDGASAEAVQTLPSGLHGECHNCGTQTWTRVSSP